MWKKNGLAIKDKQSHPLFQLDMRNSLLWGITYLLKNMSA